MAEEVSKFVKNPEHVENARVGYEVASAVYRWEGDLVWSKFNAMLVANSILLGGFVWAVTGQRQSQMLSFGLPAAGFALCVLWFLLSRRGFSNYKFWIYCARELESEYLAPVKSLSEGDRYRRGESVKFSFGKSFELKTFAHLGVETAAYWIIAVFFVLYAAALAWAFKQYVFLGRY